MSNEEGKAKIGATPRPYDEAFKRAAVAQWQSGVPARRVAEGLGITTQSLRTWRRQLGGTDATLATTVEGKLPTVAPTSQEPASAAGGARLWTPPRGPAHARTRLGRPGA